MSDKVPVNIEILRQIGRILRQRRIDLKYSQKDLSNLSGLTTNTLSSVENGSGTSLDHFLTICRALRIQPREVFGMDVELVPEFNLPPHSQKRLDITVRLEQLIHDSDFFNQPKRISDVLDELKLDRSLSNRFSVYLTSYCKEGVLEYARQGKVKHYKNKN